MTFGVVPDDPVAFRCEHVWKLFQRGRRVVQALIDINLSAQSGEFLCLIGPSGSGKSTLLNLLGALDLPTKGEVFGFGYSYRALGNEGCNRFRRANVGFVFQELRLVPHLTAAENIMLPTLFDGADPNVAKSRARELLDRYEMDDRHDHFPFELSYGERQRVAIARAVFTRPRVVLADEPTANLDDENAERVTRSLYELRAAGTTVVVATHDDRITATADRAVRLTKGALSP